MATPSNNDSIVKAFYESTLDESPSKMATLTNNDPIVKALDEKPSKSSVKKAKKAQLAKEAKEAKEKKKREAEEEKKSKKIEESKSIVLKKPETSFKKIKIDQINLSFLGYRVCIHGWAHYVRFQGRLMFIDLRDGSGHHLQCVFEPPLSSCYEAVTLHKEASIVVYGYLKEEKVRAASKGGFDLLADYWELIGSSDGEYEMRINADSTPHQLFDNRHLAIRRTEESIILKMRCYVLQYFREFLYSRSFTEVTPPSFVKTQCEGGSTLFSLKYFDEKAYLTQSSQLYMETCVPAIGNCFCIAPSFRAEKSKTRRHLAEYTHLEGEMGFITFEDLLEFLEDLIIEVSQRTCDEKKDFMKILNPKFEPLKKNEFVRMTYTDAIEWLKNNKVYKDEEQKTFYEFGDDIPEEPERKMADTINKPILLMRFPVALKAFYMQKCVDDPSVTESVDLLLPNVGEIIGGSMRIWEYGVLMEAFKKNNLPTENYYWYTDIRKIGAFPHGGFGIGIERFLCWLLNLEHIRECCLYPRYIGRCQP